MSPAGPGPADADARILDRGYRRYEGPRLGARGAQRALFVASIQRMLGLRRRFRHKIVPIVVITMAYLPAASFVGAAALIPEGIADEVVPSYGNYYGFVTSAILLFVAVTVPDALCSDRRTGLIGQYLAAPLTRDTYLATKLAAVATTINLVTLGPPLLLLVGYSLVDVGPSWPGEGLLLVVRIVAAALVVTLWYTGLSVLISSLTDRRGFAAAGIVLAALVSAAVATSLSEGAGAPDWVHLGDLFNLPFEAVYRIYGEPSQVTEQPNAVIAVTMSALVLGGLAAARLRYRRLVVTR